MDYFGILASSLVNGDLAGDTGNFPISSVSGWFKANLGKLDINTSKHFLATGASSTGVYPVPTIEESSIFKEMYLCYLYDTLTRKTLMGFGGGIYSNAEPSLKDSWETVREGDSMIKRQNRNEIAKTYKSLSKDSKEHLNELIFRYHRRKAGVDCPDEGDGYELSLIDPYLEVLYVINSPN